MSQRGTGTDFATAAFPDNYGFLPRDAFSKFIEFSAVFNTFKITGNYSCFFVSSEIFQKIYGTEVAFITAPYRFTEPDIFPTKCLTEIIRKGAALGKNEADGLRDLTLFGLSCNLFSERVKMS